MAAHADKLWKASLVIGLFALFKSITTNFLKRTPPKGHLDPGEDDMTAALRETKEEAGLGSHQLKVFTDIKEELRYEAFGAPKIVTYWLARMTKYDDKVVLSDEHQDFRWLGLEEAKELSGFPDMAKCLQSFSDKLTNVL